MSTSVDFKLGEWWVRPQRNELERADEVAQIESRSMDVLVCLARHAPEVVNKETLLEEVWSDAPFIGEDVITHAIWELRKALGDAARNPSYIRTVPRKGYCLVAEVLRPQGAPLPLEGVRIDHYDLGREIGRGAMGVVYEAVDRRLERVVAIKFLAAELTRDPKACRRFEREARLAASLEHPNLATVHEVGETSQGSRYLVTALYRGGSLQDRLAGGPLEVGEATRLVRQLVAGLGAAHERDIVHRDIKPANLLLDEHGTLKICDFGIAKLLGGTDLTNTDLTNTGTPLGTPAYKSPEQSRGMEVDHRTDLWSAGVVFYELLTGQRPFEGGFADAVVHSIVSEAPRPVEMARREPVPPAIERFIARALAKDPAERFQNAEEMAAALDALDRVPEATPRSRAGWRGALVGFGIFALCVAAGLALWRVHGDWEEQSGQEEALLDPRTQEGLDYLQAARRLWLRGNDAGTAQKVREHLEKAVALMPHSAEAKGHLAVFLAERYARFHKEEDRADALVFAHAALEIDPQAALPLVARGWVLLVDEDEDEAERLVRKAVARQPTCEGEQICHLGYVVLAEAVRIQGRMAEAYDLLERGSRVGGGAIRCQLKLAQFYEKSGLKEEAKQTYLKVHGLDPKQTTALHALGNFYLEEWQPVKAVDYLRKNYELTEDPMVLSSIGYAQYQRRLWQVAIKTYQEAHADLIARGTPRPIPMMGIGDVYLEKQEKTRAQEYFRQALDIYDSVAQPGLRSRGQRAVCLAKLDRFSEAVAIIEELLGDPKQVDHFPSLLVYAGRIYALKGEREKLFEVAREWQKRGNSPIRFLKEDPAFIPYREDEEYNRILQPELMPAL